MRVVPGTAQVQLPGSSLDLYSSEFLLEVLRLAADAAFEAAKQLPNISSRVSAILLQDIVDNYHNTARTVLEYDETARAKRAALIEVGRSIEASGTTARPGE